MDSAPMMARRGAPVPRPTPRPTFRSVAEQSSAVICVSVLLIEDPCEHDAGAAEPGIADPGVAEPDGVDPGVAEPAGAELCVWLPLEGMPSIIYPSA